VDAAIALFSGENAGPKAREIWLVDKAPVVIKKLEDAVQKLDAYIATLKAGEALSETTIREGYQHFKAEKQSKELAGLATAAMQAFVDGILQRMIFDGEQLGDLMAPLGLGWKARTQAELALMDELTPLLRKRAQGRDISGLNAYETHKKG